MAEYIEREAFLAEQRHLYCENCDRRKGMKNGKMKFVYAIGDAPCRACDIGDMLDSVEDSPAADVVPVAHGRWKPYDLTWGRSVYACTACEEAFYVPTEMGKPIYAYFPNCGALMDKDGDGDV